MKKRSPTELKKAPAAKGQAEAKPNEVTTVGEPDEKTPAVPSPPEPSANQPTPTEISQMTIALAQARRTLITHKNRDNLLRDAYDLWRSADNLIRERERIAAQEAATRERQAWQEIAKTWNENDTVTFKDMVEKKLVPCEGSRNKRSQFITTVEGIKKAFYSFYQFIISGEADGYGTLSE